MKRSEAVTIEQMREALKNEPFRPFVIHIADGRQVRVAHPEFVAFTGGGRTIFVGSNKGDGYQILDLLLVTSIEIEDTKRSGKRRRAG